MAMYLASMMDKHQEMHPCGACNQRIEDNAMTLMCGHTHHRCARSAQLCILWMHR